MERLVNPKGLSHDFPRGSLGLWGWDCPSPPPHPTEANSKAPPSGGGAPAVRSGVPDRLDRPRGGWAGERAVIGCRLRPADPCAKLFALRNHTFSVWVYNPSKVVIKQLKVLKAMRVQETNFGIQERQKFGCKTSERHTFRWPSICERAQWKCWENSSQRGA